MRKLLSIFLSVIMLGAMFHFSIASHYCGGIKAGTIISVTGRLASCGMESDDNEMPLSGPVLSRLCCENFIQYCGVNPNYVPSFPNIINDQQQNNHIFAVPVNFIRNYIPNLFQSEYCTNPTRAVWSTEVDLSDIRVFRI